MKVLLLLPTAYAAISATQPKLFDAGHMKDTFKAIASQRGASNKLDNVTRANIDTILNLITGNLTSALTADYQAVISDFNAAVAELQACNTAAAHCEVTSARTAFNNYEDAVDANRYCRQHERSTCVWAANNRTVIDTRVRSFGDSGGFQSWEAGTVEDDDCYAQGGDVLGWVNNALDFLGTHGRGCDSTDGEVCRHQGQDSHSDFNSVAHTFGCTGAATGEHGSNGTFYAGCDYKTERSNFLIACELYEDQEDQCDNTVQPALETAHCDWLNAGCTCCSTFDGCWTRESGELAAETTRAREMIDLIKHQQTALEILICYGNEILSDDAIDFDNCDSKTCINDCAQYPDVSDDTQPRHANPAACAGHFHQDTENPQGQIYSPDVGGPYEAGSEGACWIYAHPNACTPTCTN